MEALRSVWAAKPGPAQPEYGDEVFPALFMDQAAHLKDLVFTSTWLYDDVLDAQKLHVSLSQLLEIGDWRKLGGRFKRGQGQAVQLHVPKAFSKERPAVAFTHETYDMRLDEHPLAVKFPEAAKGHSFHPGPEALLPLTSPPGHPVKMDDYLTSDHPALSLFVVSFADATIVSLLWPHALTDATGLSTIVQAWSLVLGGRKREVRPLAGTHQDILLEAGSSAAAQEEKLGLDASLLKGLQFALFVVFMIWDMLWNTVEGRVIYVPRDKVERLRSQALLEITPTAEQDAQTSSDAGNGGGEKPWISESDALLALWAKCLALGQPKPPAVNVMNPFELRKRLPGFMEPDEPYVQNTVVQSFATLPASTASDPIGPNAIRIRRALQEQSTSPQALAMVRSMRNLWDKGSRDLMTLHGRYDAKLLITTNWFRARLFHVAQFGPAVVGRGRSRNKIDQSSRSAVAPGMPSYHCAVTLKVGPEARNCIVHLGKDVDENFWFMGMFTNKVWDIIDEQLGKL